MLFEDILRHREDLLERFVAGGGVFFGEAVEEVAEMDAFDLVISGGENISTIEVETAIGRHPAVAAVAVVSTPDEKWGERPKAFVELKDGEHASPEDILAFAKEHLPGYMRPAAVEITKLPKTATGKIPKAELRDKEWAGHDRRIG